MNVFEKNGLKLTFRIFEDDSPRIKRILVTFYNQLAAPITSLLFQVAVPKSVEMVMPPLATTTVLPRTQSPNPVTQTIQLGMQNGVMIILRNSFKLTTVFRRISSCVTVFNFR